MGLGDGLLLLSAADGAGENLLSGGAVGGLDGDDTLVPAVLTQTADHVGMLAGGGVPVVGGVARPGGGEGVLMLGRLYLLGFLLAADGAGVGLYALGGGGGLGGDLTGAPDVLGYLHPLIGVLAGGGAPVLQIVAAPAVGEGVALCLAGGEGFGALFAANAALIIQGRAGAGGGRSQVLFVHNLLVVFMGLAGQDLGLLSAADGAGIDLLTVGDVAGILGDLAVIPVVGAEVGDLPGVLAGGGAPVVVFVPAPVAGIGVGSGLAKGEGLGALFAADTALIVQSGAGAGGGGSQIPLLHHFLIEGVVRDGGQGFIFHRAAGTAGVPDGAGGGMGGTQRHYSGIPGMGTGFAIGKGLSALLAADTALIVQSGAGAGGRGSQVSVTDHLLIEGVVRDGGQGFVFHRAAGTAGVPDGAGGSVGGVQRHYPGIPGVGSGFAIGKGLSALFAADTALIVQSGAGAGGGGSQVSVAGHRLVKNMTVDRRLRFRLGFRLRFRLGLRLGLRLGFRLRLRLGFRLGRLDKPEGDGAAVLIHRLAQILALGGGRGVHADEAEPNALRQPAQAVQLLGNAGGDVLAHVGVIHQSGKTEGADGVAQGSARLHIAAGGSIGADAAQDQIIGETGLRHRRFKHHRAAPLVLRLTATVQRAGNGGVNRLRVGKGKYQLRAAVCQIGMVLGAAFVGGAVQGIGAAAPAAGKILDGAQAVFRQGEEPLVHLPVHHCLLGFNAQIFTVDVNVQGEGSEKKHRAEYQGQHFF